jgi:hypothetical protein
VNAQQNILAITRPAVEPKLVSPGIAESDEHLADLHSIRLFFGDASFS